MIFPPRASTLAADPRSVLLVNARSEPEQPDPHRLLGVPLGVLTLAQELIEEGFEPRILDQTVQAGLERRMRVMPRPLFVGISCDGGEQIIGGKEIAELAKRLWPGVPVVWGGWGPSLQPPIYEHPTSARWVDAFVRGKGNVAVRRIASALRDGSSLEGIEGLTWRDAEGGIHRGPDNPRHVPSTQASLPYDLVDWDRYMTRLGIINYISAAGCPHRCEFCSIPTMLPTFEPLENEMVIEHLRELHARGIRKVVFFDDNFLTSKKRVLDLARQLIESGLGMQWHANGRVDHLSTLTVEEFALLRESGCSFFNVGLETGDQSTADRIHKNIQVDDMFEVARRCRETDIGLTVNFIIGLPGETPESQVRSFRLLEQLYYAQPKMFVYWHLYLPSPGTPLWEEHVADGTLIRPRTLDEMLRFGRYVTEEAGYYSRVPKAIFKLDQDKSQAIAWYFYVGYVAGTGSGPLAPLRSLLRRWCRWRFDHSHFRIRADWHMFYWPRRLKRRWLWVRRGLVRRRPELQRWLFPAKQGYMSHFSLLFDSDWSAGNAVPVGGSGQANRLRTAPPMTLCE